MLRTVYPQRDEAGPPAAAITGGQACRPARV